MNKFEKMLETLQAQTGFVKEFRVKTQEEMNNRAEAFRQDLETQITKLTKKHFGESFVAQPCVAKATEAAANNIIPYGIV